MPKFSRESMDKLATCHPELQMLFNEVIKHYDCTILEGHRLGEVQDELFRKGLTKVKYPNSKHNNEPSLAVDVAPYFEKEPHIRWEDKERFYHFVGFVKGVASQMKIDIRCGADWDGDNDLKDQIFFDLPHFELIIKRRS